MDLLTVLYDKVLKHDPQNPRWEDRDMFILSAGHKAVGLYVVLQAAGYFDEAILWTYNSLHARVPMHPDEKKLPGVEFPTGSLGHGLSVAGGLAAAFKRDHSPRQVFVLVGDGESNEGAMWEAMLTSAKYQLDNLVVILDHNGLQSEGFTRDILPIGSFENIYREFGWAVRSIDGHDMQQIYAALTEAPYAAGKPTCIVANTVKAKGIAFAENDYHYHHWTPTAEQGAAALASLRECHECQVGRSE
jgi:transketolase